MFERVRRWVAKRRSADPARPGAASEFQRGAQSARSRPTGGRRDHNSWDNAMTTGPGRNETFVGRVSGDDVGYTGETGAEARKDQRDR